MPKPRAIPIILILVMAISAFAVYPQLPLKIPTHFGVSGQPDEWGPKTTIFHFPGLSALAYLLLLGLPRIDPFRRNYERFSRVYEHMEAIILSMFTFFYVLTLVAVFFSRLPIDRLLMAGVSIIFILLGNKLGLVKRNFFLGIRTPWTLANEEVWVKTHRLGARLLVLVGLVGLIGTLVPIADPAVPLLAIPLIIVVVITTIYSYIVWRQLNRKGNSALQL